MGSATATSLSSMLTRLLMLLWGLDSQPDPAPRVIVER
jgi:hypothetical protein